MNQQGAWIIGGSSGLGAELVVNATKNNIYPVVVGRTPHPKHGGYLYLDFSDEIGVSKFCKTVKNMDIENIFWIIWNASVLEFAPLDKAKNIDDVIKINILHPTKLIQAFVERKKELNSSFHLVTISSIFSWMAWPDVAVYCGSKAYQAQFSRSLAIELHRDIRGSKVTVVKPAGINTALARSINVSTEYLMEASDVAGLIWMEVLRQDTFFNEFQIVRRKGKLFLTKENYPPQLSQ